MTVMIARDNFRGDRHDLEAMLFDVDIDNTKKYPLRDHYQYSITKDNNDRQIVICIHDTAKKKIAGAMFLIHFARNTYVEQKIVVLKQYKGQGLGQALHHIVFDVCKFDLVSSGAQTKDGLRLWTKLVRRKDITIRGMAPVNRMKGSTVNKAIKRVIGKHTVDELVAKPAVMKEVCDGLAPVLKEIGASFFPLNKSYVMFPVHMKNDDFTSEHFKMIDNGITFLYAVSSKRKKRAARQR